MDRPNHELDRRRNPEVLHLRIPTGSAFPDGLYCLRLAFHSHGIGLQFHISLDYVV